MTENAPMPRERNPAMVIAKADDIEIAALREALAPFAAIALVRDHDPRGPDMLDAPDLAITLGHVRAARRAMTGTR